MQDPQNPDIAHRRTIRSYACRETRLTPVQKHCLETDMPRFGLFPDHNNPFNFETLFGRDATRILEIGFGDSRSFLEMAKAAPESDFIGIEVYVRGIVFALAGISKLGLSNVRVIKTDATECLTSCVPNHSLDKIQIFFADPWPKTRHHKRRLIQTPFIDLLSEKLKAGGILHLATDWEHYARHMMSVLSPHPQFRNLAGEGMWTPRPSSRPMTKYEKRAIKEGRTIYDLCFERRACTDTL